MQKKSLITILGLAILTVAISGCGKKRPMEVAVKNDHESVFKSDEDYLYLISVSDADSRVQASRPHWMGLSKIVRFNFNKSALEVRQVVDDPRFKNNPTNEKPVLSIPVTYKNYRCKENDFKECTNREEAEEDTKWENRKYFIPDYEKLEVTEQSFLPLALDKLDEDCFAQTSQRIISSELKPGAKKGPESLNIELERTYRIRNESCAKDILAGSIEEYLDAMVFKVRYHISIVEAAKLTDSRYQEVLYPQADHSKFGFFTTSDAKLDIDNRPTADKALIKLNRWSPNRKEIVYYLNDAFEREEHAKIKLQTLKVADAVNAAFKEAGTDLTFKVKSAPKGMSGEDLRNSMIILVPEAMDSGLLGYGPSAVNPKTGEIVHGRVVMYLGNMKQFIHRTWDEVVLEQISRKNPGKYPSIAEEAMEQKPDVLSKKLEKNSASFADDLMTLGKPLKLSPVEKVKRTGPALPGGAVIETREKAIDVLTKFQRSPFTNKHSLVRFGDKEKDLKEGDIDGYVNRHLSELEYYSNNNYYPADYFGFENAIMSAFKGEIPPALLKTWSQMTESERAKVIELVLPVAWTVTLIHEIGHTLGLRHNFSGSEDKENFYTDEELKAKGIDHKIHISSVMEYPFEDIGALPVMGKYDIAALRFGYKREVLLADGKTMLAVGDGGIKASLEGKIAAAIKDKKAAESESTLELKSFAFCTDEHTAANPNCKRFDTGTNLKEIAQHQINVYERYYKYRNFRYGRRFFNISTDGAYLSRMAGTFRDMRLFFERYESVREWFPDESKWETDPALAADTREFLKNLKEGVRMIADHLMGILVQPDVTCLYKLKDVERVQVLPLVWLQDHRANPHYPRYNGNVYNCMRDLVSNERMQFVGQVGRFFNSRKDPANENPYVDEIDVRGIMIDKVLASHNLIARYIGSINNDTVTSNFLDIPGYREKIVKLYMSLLLDEVPVKISTVLKDGSPYEYKGFSSLWWTHMIRPSGSARVNRVLRIGEEMPFAEMLLRQIERNMADLRDPKNSADVLRVFQVSRNLNSQDVLGRDYEVLLTANGNKFYIFEENTLANWIFSRWKTSGILGDIEDEIKFTLATAINGKKNKEETSKALQDTIKAALNITDADKAAEKLAKSLDLYEKFSTMENGKEWINMAALGLIKPQYFYENLISSLPDPRLGRMSISVNANINVRGGGN